jgi:GAF domain-containing protein
MCDSAPTGDPLPTALATLQDLLTALTRETDRSALLTRIMRQAVVQIDAAGAGDIFLWDEPTQCLIPRAWHNLGDWIRTVRLRLGEGVAGTAAQRREGVLVNDYARSSYASGHFTRRLTHTAVMAAPMVYRGTLLGAITVGNEGTGQPFTPADLQQLALFATLAALAVVLPARAAD